jgi:hypothetical protein
MRYRSLNCDGCPLVALCLQKKKDGEPATGADGRVRNIRRDAYVDVRERAATRMATPESKAQYSRRSPIAETPFASLKGVLGLRQFSHVGLEKVETEWRWAYLTMNRKKVLSVLSRLRRQTRCPQPGSRPPKSAWQCDLREIAGLVEPGQFEHRVQRSSSATRPFDTTPPPVLESRRSKNSSYRRGDPCHSVILQRAPSERVKVHSMITAIHYSRAGMKCGINFGTIPSDRTRPSLDASRLADPVCPSRAEGFCRRAESCRQKAARDSACPRR